MTLTELNVIDICKRVAPTHGFEPTLIAAICKQECYHPPNNTKLYVLDFGRLEQNYYRKYVVERHEYATTTEILLAASYGLTQMLGDSLREAGYFKDFFEHQTELYQQWYGENDMVDRKGNPVPWMSEVSVPKAINQYLVTPTWQVEWGCRWLKVKQGLAGGDLNRAIDLYNGDLTGGYRSEVLKKQEGIKREYGLD